MNAAMATMLGYGVKELGGRTLIDLLHPEDMELITALRNKGLPIVVVLVSGRPLGLGQALDAASAVVAAWLPGSEGQGVADVLFGDFDFCGRLPFSWPASSAQISREWGLDTARQFPLGFGISYQS